MYRVILYAQGKETPRQELTERLKAVGDELGSLNVQETVYQNPEWLIRVVFVILLFTLSVAAAEGICSWGHCFLVDAVPYSGIQGSTVRKEQMNSAWTTSFEGFGPPEQGRDQPKTPVKDTPEEREV